MDKSHKYALVKFIKFVNDELDIQNPYKVNFARDRDEDLKTYAYYNPQNGFIKVYCKNRGMADVMRSIAHELIHHVQNQRGMIQGQIQDIGGHIEDEANSVAGQFVKKFGYANPKLAIYSKTL
jgi:Zn-dependent peptidase ImmA (M78 family)